MAQGQASRPGTGGCVTKGGLSLVGAEQVDFEKSRLLPPGNELWQCWRGRAAPSHFVWLAPLRGEAGDLWDEAGRQHCPQIPPGLNSHPVTQASSLSLQTQTIEGSVLQGHPGTLWLMCAAGSSVLGAGLFVKPSPRAQAGPGSPTACCPRPWDKVIWCRTCICTGAPEWLWGLCLGSDQVWGTLASFWRFSPLHLSSQTAT